MADKSAEFQIRITAKLGEVRAALAALEKEIGDVGKKSQQTSKQVQDSGKKTASAFRTAATAVGSFVAAIATIQTATALIRIADQAEMLSARLKIVSATTEEAERAQARLFDIAQSSGSGLEATADLYIRLATATKELGLSQDETLGTTETINKAMQLSGVTAEAASAALIQLGQGFASGALRGDELNSVLEQAPRLASAIAAGMGKTVGELRALGEAGSITAESIINALKAQAGVINEEFAQLPDTVGRSMTRIGNSVIKIVEELNRASGATAGIASAINSVSATLDSGVIQDSLIRFGATWSASFEAIAGDIDRTIDTIAEAFAGGTLQDALEVFGTEAADVIPGIFRDMPANIRAVLQIAIVELAAFKDKVLIEARLIRDNIKAVFTDDTQEAASQRAIASFAAVEQARDDTIAQIFAERDAAREAGNVAVEALQRQREERKKLAATASAPGKGKAAKGPAGAVDTLELAKDSTERELKEIERKYQQAELSAAAYYARRTELQQQAIDQEIAIQQQALGKLAATDAAGRGKILTQIAILQRDRADVQRQAVIDAAKSAREMDEQMAELQVRSLELAGQTTEARKLELIAEFRDLTERLKAEGNEAGLALVDNIINVESAKARLDELTTEIDRIKAEFDLTQQNAANAVQAGQQSGSQAQAAIQASGQASLAAMQALRQELALLASQEVPGAAEALAELDSTMQSIADSSATGVEGAIRRLRAELADMEQNWQGDAIMSFRDNLAGLFESIADGSKTASEALKDFVKGFVSDMAAMAAKALATRAVLAMFGGGGGGGFLAGLFHEGGIVGASGGRRRLVPPSTFAYAARYHSGGVPGLQSGEVPAILQTGEEVLARDDPRNVANGGGGGRVTINQTIVTPDADSFNRSRMQSMFDAQREADTAFRRNR